jgi:5-methylthioadenosine/S-adenosylhomocysteine deaminase
MELSADWVLPVDGPPIADGRVRWEEGRIVEVGTGRAERHFADAAITPGFVNAHSHLEYSRYAGFGDGQPFGPWIATHVARKNLLDPPGMLALALQGVLDSLASGITTTADYSFSGGAATAAAQLGLRAIVYLEVFAREPADAERQYLRKRDGLESVRSALSSRSSALTSSAPTASSSRPMRSRCSPHATCR